jgi:hypothetical protein
MDSDLLLERVRHFVQRILEKAEERDQHHAQSFRDSTAENMALLFVQLDDCLTKGGELPQDWRNR